MQKPKRVYALRGELAEFGDGQVDLVLYGPEEGLQILDREVLESDRMLLWSGTGHEQRLYRPDNFKTDARNMADALAEKATT